MEKVVVIGGGWAGCAAAVAAAKQGVEVVLLEKTDMLLGAGNAGGIMRNNGRFTAAEENIAMGASELFNLADECSIHKNIDFPGHDHASFYDIAELEPRVLKLLRDMDIDVRLGCRAADVVMGGPLIDGIKCYYQDREEMVHGAAFVEATGSSGPMGNCQRYGHGCAMCVQRCPSFGPRISITERAGGVDLVGKRASGQWGALSGSCKLEKKSLSPELIERLEVNGYVVIKLSEELIDREKLTEKVCQQYALDEFAENLILIDVGQVKVMSPFFPLEKLRRVEGLERARFVEPMAGGRGNSVRYMSVGERNEFMVSKAAENLFLAGEKSGLFVGHTEAITTGSLAGYNCSRFILGRKMISLPTELATGLLIEEGLKLVRNEEGMTHRLTFAGGELFGMMKNRDIYSCDREKIRKKVEQLGVLNIYNSR